MDDRLFSYYLEAYDAGRQGLDTVGLLRGALAGVQSLRCGFARILAVSFGTADARDGRPPAEASSVEHRLSQIMVFLGGVAERPLDLANVWPELRCAVA